MRGMRDNLNRQRIKAGIPHNPSISAFSRWKRKRSQFAPWVSERSSPRRNLWAGVILDEFSSLAFRFEWNQLYLRPKDWREQLEAQPIDILFVESAWHGNNGSWRYLLTRKDAVYEPLANLVAWCQERKIPTVFWNKEDPAHFTEFLPVAKLFDYVYTTDGDLLDTYRQKFGHDRVALFPFAAQPAIHYPHRESVKPLRDVAFGGMYFTHKFPERRDQMDAVLGGAHDASAYLPHGFDIFSRHEGNKRYQFPHPLNKHVIGSLPYEHMLSAYRAYKVFLNVNSVVKSSTMCARRLFELGGCAIPVISTPSTAIPTYFDDDEIIQVSDRKEARNWILALCRSDFLRELYGYNAHMKILSEHTYTHRINAVLNDIGLNDHHWELPAVSVLLCTNRPHNLHSALETCARQKHVKTQILIGTHGFKVSNESRHYAHELGLTPVWTSLDHTLTLGTCYNKLLEQADCPVVAKIDDDDWYGDTYLLEQVSALDSMQADLVGKASHLIRFHHRGMTAWQRPTMSYTFCSFVAGATIVTSTDLLRELRFPDRSVGEDTELLNRLNFASGRIFSTSPFGFMVNRYESGHSWNQSESELLSRSVLLEADSWQCR